MKLEIYAAGYAGGIKDARRSACGVIMIASHAGGRVQRRELAFKAGMVTANYAALAATRAALLAIKRRPEATTLYVDRYVVTMLEEVDGVFKNKPAKNTDTVIALRGVYEKLRPIVVVGEKFASGLGGQCMALAKDAAIKQENSDTGTYEHGPEGQNTPGPGNK